MKQIKHTLVKVFSFLLLFNSLVISTNAQTTYSPWITVREEYGNTQYSIRTEEESVIGNKFESCTYTYFVLTVPDPNKVNNTSCDLKEVYRKDWPNAASIVIIEQICQEYSLQINITGCKARNIDKFNLKQLADNRKSGNYKMPITVPDTLKPNLTFATSYNLPETIAIKDFNRANKLEVFIYPGYVFPKFGFSSQSYSENKQKWINFASDNNTKLPYQSFFYKEELTKIQNIKNNTRNYYYFNSLPLSHDFLISETVSLSSNNEFVIASQQINIKDLLTTSEYNQCVNYDPVVSYPKFETGKDYLANLSEYKQQVLQKINDPSNQIQTSYTDFNSWVYYLLYINQVDINGDPSTFFPKYETAMKCLLNKLENSGASIQKINQSYLDVLTELNFSGFTTVNSSLPFSSSSSSVQSTVSSNSITQSSTINNSTDKTTNIANTVRTGGFNLNYIVAGIILMITTFLFFKSRKLKLKLGKPPIK